MIKVLTDQNFDGRIIKGLSIRIDELDLVRTEDEGIKHFPDFDLLTWAATEDRVVITHDKKTFDTFAYQKIELGEKMVGVVVVPSSIPIGQAIEHLMILILCSADGELNNRVVWLPL